MLLDHYRWEECLAPAGGGVGLPGRIRDPVEDHPGAQGLHVLVDDGGENVLRRPLQWVVQPQNRGEGDVPDVDHTDDRMDGLLPTQATAAATPYAAPHTVPSAT